MAKSIRSKVKKRLRSVKRAVIKRDLRDPTTKLGVREVAKQAKLQEATSGYLKPGVPLRSGFRYDDGEIAQHNWRQGPDYRSSHAEVESAGYAVVGASRPKLGRFGGDAPTGRPDVPADAPEAPSMPAQDPGVQRLLMSTEQLVPAHSSKKNKRKIKAAASKGSITHVWT